MPRSSSKPTEPIEREATEAELVAAREAFEVSFTRNAKGNLFQTTEDGTHLVVFKKWGHWYWRWDDGTNPPRYSSEPCSEATYAVGDLWRAWMGAI